MITVCHAGGDVEVKEARDRISVPGRHVALGTTSLYRTQLRLHDSQRTLSVLQRFSSESRRRISCLARLGAEILRRVQDLRIRVGAIDQKWHLHVSHRIKVSFLTHWWEVGSSSNLESAAETGSLFSIEWPALVAAVSLI